MGDYLYNSEMGPRACVSICQAAWSTDGLAVAHLLSLTLHCILLFRSSIVLVDLCIFSGSSARLKQSLNLLLPQPSGSSICSNQTGYFFSFFCFFFFFPLLLWVVTGLCFPRVILFLPSSTLPCVLVCGFWAMLSSPTVILQPYGLPVYPQTTTCYPSIVQVKFKSTS